MDIKIVSPVFSKVAQYVIKNLPIGGICLVIFDDKFINLSHKSLEDLMELSYEEILSIIRKIVHIESNKKYIYFCCYDVCLEKVFFITKENRDALFFCRMEDL